MFTLLVVAGNETTRNALSGGLVAFSRFPDQHAKLLEHPELIDLAVEEIVRYVSPVISFTRTVTEDHTYQGVDLKAGDRVFLLYQSANRDEDVFDDRMSSASTATPTRTWPSASAPTSASGPTWHGPR